MTIGAGAATAVIGRASATAPRTRLFRHPFSFIVFLLGVMVPSVCCSIFDLLFGVRWSRCSRPEKLEESAVCVYKTLL
jgi:hypothetical protein